MQINVNDGPESNVLAERQWFIEQVSNLGESKARAKVVEHLRSVNHIVLCQLLGDADDSGVEANGQRLEFFVENYGGQIQADG